VAISRTDREKLKYIMEESSVTSDKCRNAIFPDHLKMSIAKPMEERKRVREKKKKKERDKFCMI
jgi:hypothetical protein